jgi:hypothetical protein
MWSSPLHGWSCEKPKANPSSVREVFWFLPGFARLVFFMDLGSLFNEIRPFHKNRAIQRKKKLRPKKTEDRPAFGFQPNSHYLYRINQLLQVINYYKCVTF